MQVNVFPRARLIFLSLLPSSLPSTCLSLCSLSYAHTHAPHSQQSGTPSEMSWRAQATFRDVMVPNQLALRADGRPIKSGPTTTSVHAPTALGVTQRRTQRNTSLTQENLTQTAATRRRRSEAHVVAAPDPPMRSAIRAETNRGICDQRRNQQALVLSLREVHLAATQGESPLALWRRTGCCSCARRVYEASSRKIGRKKGGMN